MADRTFNVSDRIEELGEDPAQAYAGAKAAGQTDAMPPLEIGQAPPAPVTDEDPTSADVDPPADPDAALHHAAPGKFKPAAAAPAPKLPPLESTGTIADTQEIMPDLAPVQPSMAPIEDPADLASLGEVASASRRLAAGDNQLAAENALRKGYAPLIDALHLDPGENPANFNDGSGYGNDLLTTIRYGFRTRQQQEQRLAELIRAARVKDPSAFKGVPDDPAKLRDFAMSDEKKAREEARATLERSPGGIGGTLAELGGSAGGSFADLTNLVTLPIGGGGKTVLQVAGRELLAQSALEALQLPGLAATRKQYGEQLTGGEAALDVAGAGIGGSVLGAGFHAAGHAAGAAIDRMMPKIFEAMPASVQRRWADRMNIGGVKLTDVLTDMDNREISEFAKSAIGEDKLTPDERAATNVLERGQEIGESSPYQPGVSGDTAHAAGLEAAIADLENSKTPDAEGLPSGPEAEGTGTAVATAAPERPPAALSTAERPRFSIPGFTRPRPGDLAATIANVKQKIAGAENSGKAHGRNPKSSADGRYQITDGTFRGYYKRLYGVDPGEHPPINLKENHDVQERIMDALTSDNAAALQHHGEAVSEGNLYLMHVLGERDALRVLKADASTPIENILSADVIHRNPQFQGGKSTSQVAAWAHTKMDHYYPVASVPPRGEIGALDPASGDPENPQLNAEALQLDNEVIGAPSSSAGSADVPPMYARAFNVDDITVDAHRFQFKGGGDEAGVTDRLRGVKQWNPLYAGRVIVWEDKDGRAFLADGHQRHGLAKRIQDETGEPIRMDALVLRHADGVTAEDARVYAALKNIAEGTGTAIDAAKVVRDAGAHVLDHLPPKSALVRDGGALARLSDAAFGAVYNDVVPADYAAVIGHLLPDRPEAHEAMIDLLAKLDPANRGQAESIVRQAISDGLHKEEQIDLFGSSQKVTSLYLERAKVLEKGLAKLRKLGSVFKVAAEEADTLEAAGSRIARDKSAKEAHANAAAVEIVSRLAFSRGAVADALNEAAAELAAGAKLGSVVDRFVEHVRGLDLRAVAGEAANDDASRIAPDGAGRGGDAPEEGPQPFAESGDQEQPSLIELEHATERFSDPDGPAVKQQAESLIHDFRAALDENEESVDLEHYDQLSDREIAEELADQVLGDALDDHAIATNRELSFPETPMIGDPSIGEGDFDPNAPYEQLRAKIVEQALDSGKAGEYEQLVKTARRALENGSMPVVDHGAPPIAEQIPMGRSDVVPEPANPMKSADYAGPELEPAQAKARLAEWKAEAQRIGRESPPPSNHVILSFFDASGTWSKPYEEMGYHVIRLDAKHGHDLLKNMVHYMRAIDEAREAGLHIAGVIAQPPCTTFASSGARWWGDRHNRQWGNLVQKMWGRWATKEFDSPLEYNRALVAVTEEYIHRAAPDFFVIENPNGRIASETGLPKPQLVVQPHHFGDPYTKHTNLWGKFNPELPTANVHPAEGSRVHKLRSRDEKENGLRSLTPEGFAYAFALANRPGTDVAAHAVPSEPVLHGEAPTSSSSPEAIAARRDQIRAATAALEGGKAGELKTIEPFAKDEPGYHRFRYVATDGTPVGGNYTLDGNLIEGFSIGDTHARAELGPSELRNLFEQLRAEHPNVDLIHGYRMSGARTAAGDGEQEIWIKLTDKGIKLSRTDPRLEAAPKAEAAAPGAVHDAETIIAKQKGASLDELMVRAQENQPQLEQFGRELAGKIEGVEFVAPRGGVKSLERTKEKLAEEGYSEPGEIKDLARATFTVKDPAQSDQLVAGLRARFPIFDKDWKPRNGYLDRKVIVQFPNGGVAEVQIVPEPIADYKLSGEGKRLYHVVRDPNTSGADFDRALEQMHKGYDELLAGTSFEALGKASRNSSEESSEPALKALRAREGEASRQEPAVNTNALSADATATGRSSSSKNLMASASPAALDMGLKLDPGKAAKARALAQLGAAAPMRAPSDVGQLGEIGLPLMDKADQGTFRLDEEGEEISPADLLADLEADDKAIKAMKDCL
jgi:hypothetical protein